MPKPVLFNANSVVYFRGDVDDRIYILKSGRVALRSYDIETGQLINDLIKTGEFFGVKSALGRFPREEDAVALSDAQLLQFNVDEFERVVSSNTRIIVKMLKVFSNQLRRIHVKVSSMLNQVDQVDPEEGLFHSGLFYYQNQQLEHAEYIFERYVVLYPQGKRIDEVRVNIERIKRGGEPPPPVEERGETGGKKKVELSESAHDRLIAAEHLMDENRYGEALSALRTLASDGTDSATQASAAFQIGRVLFLQEAYDDTIRYYSQLVKGHIDTKRQADALFYMGASYQRSGRNKQAQPILEKARTMAQGDAVLLRRIEQEMERSA